MSNSSRENWDLKVGIAFWGIFVPLCGFGWLAQAVSNQPSLAWEDAILRCFFAVLAWPTRWRWPIIAPGILYVLAVAVSRLYLGLHYPSDILGGWALSLAWVTTASFVSRIPMNL
jgi:membrane-associated phospholipid phosphatase